jgi:predicted amidophosphoribosyltransferase
MMIFIRLYTSQMYSLLQIDELQRSFHHFLTPEDECFYFMEYTSNTHYLFSPANDLISNFKKSPEHRDHSQWAHKERAIRIVSEIFAQSLLPASNLLDVILVPMPPSKRKDHLHYDDRIMQVLVNLQKLDDGFDVREILSCRENMEPFHATSNKRNPEKIAENLSVDINLCNTPKKKILLVDDIVTSGAHFKACKNKLLEHFSEGIIKGLFIARRTFNSKEE